MRETFCIDITEVKDHRSPSQAKQYGQDECASWVSWVLSVWGGEERGGEGVHDLCLSVSSSFDLQAGKDMARNKCLGHDILSMLGHCILAIWWQMTEQGTWSHL